MRVSKIRLKNFKQYVDEITFDFSESEDINTISGVNGSGKTTIFESMLLLQKAYFLVKIIENTENEIEKKRLSSEFEKELLRCSSTRKTQPEIEIELNFESPSKIKKFEEYETVIDGKIYYRACGRLFNDGFDEDTGEHSLKVVSNEVIYHFWNPEDPKEVIFFLNADKNVNEKDFQYNMLTFDEESHTPILQTILSSDSVYQNMYIKLLNSYIVDRVIPGNRMDFYNKAKLDFQNILPDKHFTNFSGKEIKNQYVLLAKGNSTTKFDSRGLSSGEKLVWYTLLIINYVKNIGLLIIDEPENHLHEKLSWNFINYLATISQDNQEVYIGQIFLITHSKNIIYNNFSVGSNFVIDDTRNIRLIKKEECEDILRDYGLSYTDDKIIFVEGKTEVELLETIASQFGIKVKELDNCAKIIAAYRSLSKLEESFLYSMPEYLFLIDRDTREEREIGAIASENPSFFDKHFIILNVHEIENFLLDSKIISEEYNKLSEALHKNKKSEEKIHSLLRKYADESLEQTKSKYLNSQLREEIKRFADMIKQRDIASDTSENYTKYVEKLFLSEDFNARKQSLVKKFDDMTKLYSSENWERYWLQLCDGKIVANRTIGELANELGISKSNLKNLLWKRYQEGNGSEEYKKFIGEIKMKLKI